MDISSVPDYVLMTRNGSFSLVSLMCQWSYLIKYSLINALVEVYKRQAQRLSIYYLNCPTTNLNVLLDLVINKNKYIKNPLEVQWERNWEDE